MTVGSVAVFQFAYNLNSVPLAIVGVSYSVAAFPLLAELFAKGDLSTFRLHINSALRHIIFWSVPAIALIVVLRAQIVRVILGSGAFNWDDTRLTAAVLAILSISLVAQAVNLLFIRALYAGGHTRAPLIISGCGFIVSVVLAYFFYNAFLMFEEIRSTFEYVFRVKGVLGTEVLMIAVAYSVSVIGQSLFLSAAIVRYYHVTLQWVKERLLKSVVASVIGGVTAYVTLNFVVFGINEERFLGIVLQGGVAGLLGVIAIIWAYYVLKMPEFFEVKETLHRRVFKVSTPVTTDEPL